MNPSLQHQIVRKLSIAILVTGTLAGIATFYFAYSDAQEVQDDTLALIASLVSHQNTDTIIQGDIRQGEEASNVAVIHSAPQLIPRFRSTPIIQGFQSLVISGEKTRILLKTDALGHQVIVAQNTEARDDLAIDSLSSEIVSMSILLAYLIWLFRRIVRKAFMPINRLIKVLNGPSHGIAVPLSEEGIPQELLPFVSAINHQMQRVSLLLGAQRRFIADAAHELRNPLTALSLQAENLKNATTLEAMHERIEPLKAGIDRSRRLTLQLLDLARNQYSHAEKEDIDIPNLFDLIKKELSHLGEIRNIRFKTIVKSNAFIHGDPTALYLIVKNALDNALRYSGPNGEVELVFRMEENISIIEVTDSGPGIPEAKREQVFEAFSRIGQSGAEGCGLGLAIARDAASKLGGTISFHDRIDQSGLVFEYRQTREQKIEKLNS
jgi:two-component system, OmpR family, sensor kinase